ncbi:hypothetical protein K431DRAFT_276765 [Polychaeton citri CBS 116435]|uniref:Heme haloperoxidase family profile domain-containing protein n=1 Tax=Polychaeton citri CBS 116435 TaxID=1314669 RepID=A0A9P4ULP5_9PEZI|nr:hypothetical protein K431DRAFT_276765 [Polychaeton citri CBS 116435]
MKVIQAFLVLPTLGWAFPQMMGREPAPQLLGGLLDTVTQLTDDIAGLTGAVAASVDPDNYRPEQGYEFQEPGPNDSRGPCPGLNLLANYGYLPRDGHVSYSQVVEATARGFNMGADLSTLLAVFAILTDGDIESESWYLGAGPGNVGGLNRHSTVEADLSPNREDYYLGCGDNHHLSSRLFKQNVKWASQSTDKDFGMETMGNQWAELAKFSQANNPYLYFFPFPSIVALGAFVFYPNFFSNGTYGQGGVANYESISSIIGAQYNEDTGEFIYVPERWPSQGWYRRSNPYGAVQALTDALTYIYPKYPVPMAIAQLGSENLNAQTVLCDVYQGLNSIIPLALAGSTEDVAGSITWALGKLALTGLSGTVLGCPTNTLSPNFLVQNSTNEGGPLNPPPAVAGNTGNNVYGKVYFETAPTSPQCG